MLKREELEKDNRFRIDDKELDLLFSKLHIYSYSFETLEIGKLRRFNDGEIVSIKDTINYRYILHPENSVLSDEYQKYCREKDNLIDNPNRSQSVYFSLRDELSINEYDPQKAAIIVNQYNIIEDGLHRSCIILAHHGEKYKVKVVKIRRKNSRKLLYLSPIYELKHLFRNHHSIIGERG